MVETSSSVIAAFVVGSISLGYVIGSLIHSPRPRESAPKTTSPILSDKEAISILYSTGQQNLISFKDNQWSVTSYALIAVAAVVAAHRLLPSTLRASEWIKTTGIALIALIADSGIYQILKLQGQIVQHRVRLNEMKLHMFRDGLVGYVPMSEREIAADKKLLCNGPFPILLICSVLLGVVIAFSVVILA